MLYLFQLFPLNHPSPTMHVTLVQYKRQWPCLNVHFKDKGSIYTTFCRWPYCCQFYANKFFSLGHGGVYTVCDFKLQHHHHPQRTQCLSVLQGVWLCGLCHCLWVTQLGCVLGALLQLQTTGCLRSPHQQVCIRYQRVPVGLFKYGSNDETMHDSFDG